jgi:nitroreductase
MLEIMRKRRSVRKFTSQDVTKAQVREILNAGMFAPSAWNRRPWHFIVVRDKELLTKLSGTSKYSKFVADAPVTIVVCGDMVLSPLWVEDTSIAATCMLLAASTMGLGSTWTEVHGAERPDGTEGTPEDYVCQVLGIPEKFGVLCMLPIGYPAEEHRPHLDQEFEEEKITYERFGK